MVMRAYIVRRKHGRHCTGIFEVLIKDFHYVCIGLPDRLLVERVLHCPMGVRDHFVNVSLVRIKRMDGHCPGLNEIFY